MIDALPRGDTWFAETGITAVRATIKAAATALPHDPQRIEVRGVVARKRLAKEAIFAEFQRWSNVGQEDILTVKGPRFVVSHRCVRCQSHVVGLEPVASDARHRREAPSQLVRLWPDLGWIVVS